MDNVNDGSEMPLGAQSEDGELEVREHPDGSRGWSETELGQHQRWMRSAPDLFEKYQASVERVRELEGVCLEWDARCKKERDTANATLTHLQQQQAELASMTRIAKSCGQMADERTKQLMDVRADRDRLQAENDALQNELKTLRDDPRDAVSEDDATA